MRGFTLIEVVIVVVVIGILAVGVSTALNTVQESRMVACTADLHAMEDMTQQYYMQTRPWTPDRQGLYQWMGNLRKDHYHYVPNNNDRNKGHGNDLDLCDEENPGKSLDNRDCLDIQWVWVCDHNHRELAKYNFSLSRGYVYSVSKTGEKPFLHDLRWWDKKDPNLRRWIGR